MGIPVLILGESGTGKSASMRNFEAEDLKVINVANKPLPFKNKFESVSTDSYKEIIKELKLNKKRVSVIDDAQYLMANEFMRRATERGYDKFTEIAQNFWNLVQTVKELPDCHVVYFLAHIERDVNGNEKIKTIGKLLDEKITVEGMFTIVLKTNVTDGVYSFLTQNSGHDTVKSPIGMFPSYAIDNDLKYVDEKIRNYYELGEFLTDEELAEIEETVKHADIPIKEEKKSRRAKRGKEKEEPTEALKEEESEETAAEEPKSRRRKKSDDNVNNVGLDDATGNNKGVASIQGDNGKPKRRSRKAELEEEREEVRERNGEKIASANLSDDKEEIPYEEAEEPELEELPKRKRRKSGADTEVDKSVSKDNEDGSENGKTVYAKSDGVEAPARRRRRRA